MDCFNHRFGPLADNDTWTRGATKLKGKSSRQGKLFGAILAPKIANAGREAAWDSIVLFDVDLQREAEQFKKDAPKRAAKDF